jgi:ELWxxDGT repeat protein
MKNKPILFFLFTLLLGSFFALQGATLPHQGRVLISGKAFEGTGSFRFALVDTAGNLVWNHQGTTGEPATDLTLDIKGGFYSVGLGDTAIQGMADLPASLFSSYAGLKLRIWFNDGTNGLQQLGTDQNLLVAPYALNIPQPSSSAGLVDELAHGISQYSSANGVSSTALVAQLTELAGKLASGQIDPNSLTAQKIEELVNQAIQTNGGTGGSAPASSGGNGLGTLRNPYGWAGVPVNNAADSNYTVPSGKVLLVLIGTPPVENVMIPSPDNGRFSIVKENTTLSPSDPVTTTNFWPTAPDGQGGFIGGGTYQTTSRTGSNFSGFLVNSKPEIDPITSLSGSSFTIPAGKYLVVSTGSVSIAGNTNGPINGSNGAEEMVILDGGANGFSITGSFTGYLISPDNLAKLGRGGADGSGSGSTSPGGPTQPGPSLPGEVAATSRSYIFVDGSAQYQEVTLPPAAQNVGKEYVIHSKISELLIKGEIQSEDYALISPTAPDSTNFFVSNGTRWISMRPSSLGSTSFGSGVFVDIVKGAGSSSPANFAVLGNHLYFSAADGINGNELWKTDGTVTGTMMVKDVNPGATGSNPTGLTVFNNALYFAATDANGTELWKSDGTVNATVLFKDFVPGSGSGNPTNIRVDGNQLRFNAVQESWNSDGTLAGTVVQAPSFSDNGYVQLGNWYYYSSSDNNGTELWRSDGSQNGAQLFKDLWPGSTSYWWPTSGTTVNSSNPSYFFVFNNTLYFSATDANGTELWKSDGTLAGTVMVKDLFPGSYQSYNGGGYTSVQNASHPRNFLAIDNVLHFSATDANGTALWKTDGTANGTVKVRELRHLDSVEMVKFGNALYYQGRDALGAELHRVEINGGTTSSNMFGSVNDLGANWKQSTWFGTYLDTNSNWIFHDALGWIYPVDSGGNENWLYDATLGWMWTNQSVYPYLYLTSSNNWIYLSNQAYYSYSSSSWTNLGGGPSAPIEDYSASKSYSIGSLARVGQDSFIATTTVPAGTSPPNTAYWTNLSVAANALGIPVESVPTLSTSTILASVPGSTPNTGGTSAPTGATHAVDLNSTVNLEMIRVEPGTFTMGSPTSEVGRGTDEVSHNVTLTKPFYLGKYEVTQAQYQAVMTGNPNGLSATPSHFAGNPNRPVEKVSWDDAQIFLARLNAAEQNASRLPAGWSYVLPTEAEWEYACRSGTTTAYSWGNSISPNNANWDHGADLNRTVIVGEFSANTWGFHDMHGNVAELCADWYGVYSSSQLTDPTGPELGSGSTRVERGGSWVRDWSILRSARRSSSYPSIPGSDLGFRLAFKQQ